MAITGTWVYNQNSCAEKAAIVGIILWLEDQGCTTYCPWFMTEEYLCL
jgi:hypothetical protein